MTHNLIHRDRFVQKAGQAAAAALPLPRWSLFREGTTLVVPFRTHTRGALAPEAGAERVAGRKTMGQKQAPPRLTLALVLSSPSVAPRAIGNRGL
jgi:hypothetical protein